MLTELSELQSSNERVWDCPEVSFTIATRDEKSDDVIERKYTFSHAPEWEKWMFTEFEETRDGRQTRHLMWHDAEAPEVSVPPEVTKKLESLLGVDEMTIQVP